MFNIGAGEMVFILIAALLILGPQRLPELARGIGKFLREFRRQTDEVRGVVVREFYAMEQDVEREPSPPPSTPVAPIGTPDFGHPEHPALPLPTGLHAPLEGSMTPAHPEPMIAAPAVAAQAEALGTVPPAETAEAPAAAPGAAPAEEEPLPRFDPIPGTVARNAPK